MQRTIAYFDSRRRFAVALAFAASGGVAVAVAAAAPVPGFVENWTHDTSTWDGGAGGGGTVTNPGTGGVDGAADGYLLLATPANGHLGAKSSGAEYAGDWLAAGVFEVRFCLNDVGAANPLEIHFAFGSGANLWQYNQGFVPPANTWAEFVVDVRDSTKFTHIITDNGLGWTSALQGVQIVLIRHDQAPFTQSPDLVTGDVGVDRFQLVGHNTPTIPTTWGRLRNLYR